MNWSLYRSLFPYCQNSKTSFVYSISKHQSTAFITLNINPTRGILSDGKVQLRYRTLSAIHFFSSYFWITNFWDRCHSDYLQFLNSNIAGEWFAFNPNVYNWKRNDSARISTSFAPSNWNVNANYILYYFVEIFFWNSIG